MLGAVDCASKQHDKLRHEQEHRQHGQQDGLYKHERHVLAQTELDKAHCKQTADGGEAACGNLGNRLGEGGYHGAAGLLASVLLGVAVAQNDGVVNGKRQLQDKRHRVGYV